MADLTPEKEQEFKFRLRLEQEQAQEKAAEAEAASQEGYVNPLTPTIVGAAVGPVVGPGISKGAMAYKETQDLIKQGWDPKVASNFVRKQYGAVENWARQMHTGEFFGGRDMPEANRMAMQSKYPQGIPETFPETPPAGMKASPKSGLILPENLATAQEKAAVKPVTKMGQMTNAPKLQSAKSALSAGLSGGIPAILGRGLAGGSTAYQGVDAYNRLKSGDISGGAISGLGALGSAASFLPHPILRYGGAGVAMGAEALNQYLDSLKQKRQGYAEGGSAKKKMSKAERAAKAIENNKKKKEYANGGPVMNPMPTTASPSISAQLADQTPPQLGLPPVHNLDLLGMPDSTAHRPFVSGGNPNMRYTPGFKEGGHATPAWQRSEGKNPEGGLNATGRASYNRETGGNLKAPQPEGGSRKKSFCARMGGMKKKLTSSETANDPDSRINKALRKWKCQSISCNVYRTNPQQQEENRAPMQVVKP